MKRQLLIIFMLLFSLIVFIFTSQVSAVSAPSVTTNNAEGVEEYNATLSGTLTDDGGENCTVWFEYGTDTSYGNNTSHVNVTINDTWSNFTSGANARYGFTKFGQYYKKELFTDKIYIKEVWIAGRGYSPTTTITARACIMSNFTTYIQNSSNTIAMSDAWTYYKFTFSPYVEIDNIDFIITCESVDGSSTFYTAAKNGDTYSNTWRVENNNNITTWETRIKLKYYYSTHFTANVTLQTGYLYHYRAVANNSNSTVYGNDKTFTTLWYPLSNASHTPGSGIANFTNFTFNITYKDPYGRNPTDIKINISTAGWYTNQSMTWQSGDNTTGANYTYTTTLGIAGTYIYVFTAYLGSMSYTTTTYTITGDITNVTFNISFPPYLEVGDYIFGDGTIRNSTGGAVDGYWAYTSIQRYNDSVTLLGPKEYYCVNGRYSFIASTGILTPGIYNITVTMQDTVTGYTYQYIYTLYLSYATPTGVYSNAILSINFYNTNEGLGLPKETLKIYINGVRQRQNIYYTYTGASINLTVKDYYNTTLYTNTFNITHTYEFIDLGLTYHEYDFTNLNEEYYVIGFLKQNATRWYEKIIPSRGYESFLIPTGDYTIRVYNADNSSYVSWSETVNSSKGYTIEGNNITQIIEGLSVIHGQILELQSELQQATQPDIVNIVCNPPRIYSIYENKGAIIGTKLVCPALFIMATTVNETTINSSTTFYPLIPSTTVNNGTVSVRQDVIYFAGDNTVTWVNVSTGSSYTNYSYIPNHIDIFGGNITIDTNGNLTVTRETQYQMIKKFYWTKYTDTKFYQTTVSIPNPFQNINITKVYVIIEYANDTTPDFVTTRLYDVSNGVYLTRGENFFTTSSGIHFYLDSITQNTSRQFTASYYATSTSQVSSDAVVIVDDYSMKQHENLDIASGKNWYYAYAQWVNPNTNSFIGNINIQFNFDTTPYVISPRSFDIYDRENKVYLSRDDFVWTGSSIIISQDAVGTVQPNGARTFDIYFLFVEQEDKGSVVEKTSEWIKQEAFYGIQWFYIIEAFLILAFVAFGSVAYDKKRSWIQYTREAWLSFIAVFFAFILFIWYINL